MKKFIWKEFTVKKLIGTVLKTRPLVMHTWEKTEVIKTFEKTYFKTKAVKTTILS